MSSLTSSGTRLIDAIEGLAGASAIEDVVAIVRSTARGLVGADGIAVILREGDYCHYVEEDAIGPLWKGRRFPMAICISGWAMLNRQTVVVRDVLQDARIARELYKPTFVRSLLMAPVRPSDPVGAIGAYWQEIREPGADEIAMLEALARAAATAIENVRLIRALSEALSEAELARDELRHRVKNAFAAAQSLAALSLPADHARTLSARIAGLARAHDLLDGRLTERGTIDIQDLIDAELQPYRHDSPRRIVTKGPRLALENQAAVALGLVVNELATNALKHGALSVPRGAVSVAWQRLDGHLVLEWRESGGPEVKAGTVENVGSRLLGRLIEGQLRGRMRRELARSGAVCTIEVPFEPDALPLRMMEASADR